MKPLLVAFFLLSPFWAFAQPSPQEFLGYPLGDAFTYHHKMVEYFKAVDAASGKVKVVQYGETSERRPLIAAFISSEENIGKLDEIRKANLAAIGMGEAGASTEMQKPFVWLSYNIHGNESVSMEAAMKVLHSLITNGEADAAKWLEEVVVVLDPCENPDGRDRYANWYNQTMHQQRNINPDTWEHNEPWPGGRYNHYLFDLNRDWAWQTQKESRHRIELYQQYMPHVHVDLHEMGYNEPYFFGPSAEPFHKSITDWQREFHNLSGVNHAKYFDKEGWLYFTKEVFDLFYPSYGDTWPTFNGAIGFTFEQGGSGRAGLAVETSQGDTLTLGDRIAHHYTTSISTIELGYLHKDRLIREFNDYFNRGKSNPDGKYKSYVIKSEGTPPTRMRALLDLLDKQKIEYAHAEGGGRSLMGFDYRNNFNSTFSVKSDDIVISAYQPQHHLVKILFEPNPELSDSITYDLTAWAVPYIYGVEAYATESKLSLGKAVDKTALQNKEVKKTPYAYAVAWDGLNSVRFLGSILQQGVRSRFAEKAFQIKGKEYPAGTLVILKGDNKYASQLDQQLREAANTAKVMLHPLATGLVDKGRDFGSESVKFIQVPKVATINGDGVSATSYGEIWHYFEQQIQYPISTLNTAQLSRVDLGQFDVIVLPSGNYGAYKQQLLEFAQEGGKLIAIDRAVRLFEGKETVLGRSMQKNNQNLPEGEELLKTYGDRERDRISKGVEGSIYKVHLDKTHPLAFGLPKSFFLVKRNSRVYPYLREGGWNVGVYKADSHIAGFVGAELKPKLVNSLAFGTERHGGGHLVYFPDSPTFRGFWHSGMGLMGNAVFLLK